MVEHGYRKPGVGGSIPLVGTNDVIFVQVNLDWFTFLFEVKGSQCILFL
ncbi:hypothetical protein LGAA44_100001 [Leuconostoc gasicomitatum]|nr:hypothetical protein LGAA44_100001 [Leuconostoc gasicomitatum]